MLLIRHVAALVVDTLRMGRRRRRLGVVLVVVLGGLAAAVGVLLGAVAPLAIYPFL